ncbi:efflux RND transporter periplasmic adaptor subunit [Anatilimnocola sp. NA78]|uniref:efflux RND transporter periplasmic adaptor subunit n=1 Tax=Anatilimnocola sp. NA78 TaxID=3415683 RepID=UPI003CE476ED
MKNKLIDLASAFGIVSLGWLAPVSAQQPAPRAFAPPPAAAPAFAPPGTAAPAFAPPASSFGNPSYASSGARQPNSGEIYVEHGLVTVIDDIKVPARDAGSLTKLYVRGGELVPGNVILGVIDDRDTLAKQRIAQGELDAATEQANSKAEIEAAEKGRDVALAEYESAKEIKAKQPGAISNQELNRARFQWERSLAQIAVAKTDNVVAGHTANMKHAQLDATAVELSKKKIVSPIQGQVVEVYKHEGEWVQPGDPVLRLVRLDRVRVEAFVYAKLGGRFEVEGKPVTVTVKLPEDKEVTVQGRVDYASPIIEGAGNNRQYRIWADIENQFVNGHFLIQPGSEATLKINIAGAKIPAPEREAPPQLEAATPSFTPAAAPVAPGVGTRTEAAPAEATSTENAAAPAAASPAAFESLKPELPAAPAAETVAPVAPAAATPAAATRPTLAPAANPAPASAAPRAVAPQPRATAPRTTPAQPAASAPRPAPRPAISGLADPNSGPRPRVTPQLQPR